MSRKKNPNQVAAIVSAMWVLFSLVSDLVKHMRELGCNIVEIGENFYALAQNEGQDALRQIAQIIAEAGQKACSIYSVAVDCTMSLAAMVALGKYDWVHSDITAEHFPVKGKEKANVAMRLFHFGQTMTTSEVEAEMNKEGWKPASIWHLLFFGAKYPELQKRVPIIALGSVWRGLVAYLDWGEFNHQRRLSLHRIDDDWNDLCRFLAVRK